MILDFDYVYDKYNLNASGIIHIGGHYGNEIQKYKSHNIDNIVLFEPLSSNFSVLSENAKNLTGNIITHQVALGNDNRKVIMNISSNEAQSSSILTPKVHLTAHPEVTFTGTEEVEMKKLDDYNYQNYNMIVIDVQGYELEVFKGATKTLNNIDYIYCEVNRDEVYEGNAHVEEIDEFLSTYGFKRVETQWYYTEVWGDALYMKDHDLLASKLAEFPSVYYISLEECIDRQKNIENQFKRYNIKSKAIISKRFSESNDIITGKFVHQLNDGTKGCSVSHLKAIKEWYETTDEDYAFFCEDDLSLETIPYWDFTWEEFVDSIPTDAECVQLLTIREDFADFKIRERQWNDWGATAYIITREYAKKIIDTYIKTDSYHLEVPNKDIMPLIENIIFTSIGKVLTIPLFVENIEFTSTFENQDDDVNNGHKNAHTYANETVLNWWKNKMIQKTELEELLTNYSLDTENPYHNFNLGVWYENQGHTAPALSYFLRCAERSEDKVLAYEALIRGSYCYDKQGTRDNSAKSMLQQALVLLPKRPEAYFLLSRFSERRSCWQDCYIYADQALNFCEFDQIPLMTDVEYPGKYGLLFEKAISGWWWEKTEESKNLFHQILDEYDNIHPEYIKTINNNLKLFKIQPLEQKEKNYTFSKDFDWSELTYEDIITIDREIIHEKVYKYWRDVKENDIVMDIGASVGPFVCSILNNKPKKVYCVEPSKELLKTLGKNCTEYLIGYTENPLVYINNGIVNNIDDSINIFGNSKEFNPITFKDLIKSYSIDKINFLKIDCEGGEYNIFREENMNFLLNNVEFISMEVHINREGYREKFKKFRDEYLVKFNNYRVMSCTRQNMSWGNSIDIKEKVFDDTFIDEYTCEFMIYISNQ